MTVEDLIADAAGFASDTKPVDARSCSTEVIVGGRRWNVDGVEYEVPPPCDVRGVVEALDGDNVMEMTTSDDGSLIVFVANDGVDIDVFL